MLVFVEKHPDPAQPLATLTLDYQARQKSRQRARLDNGQEAGIMLERGQALRHGDLLRSEDGTVIRIVAAVEKLAMVHCTDALTLARACYHLGNRHVPVQIEENQIRFQRDHVLEHMLEAMGLTVQHEEAGFEPENGAYTHHHSHD